MSSFMLVRLAHPNQAAQMVRGGKIASEIWTGRVYLSTLFFEPLNRCWQEHINLLSKVPGWRRSRRYRLVDVESHAPLNRFLGMHEYASDNGLDDSPELQHARSTPWRANLFSLLGSHTRRTLVLHYKFGPAPRDLLHLSLNEKVIDTRVPHDGYRLHYRLEGSVDDSSPVVIFCNGLNCNLHMWDATITLLKQRFPNFRFLRYGRLALFFHFLRSERLTRCRRHSRISFGGL